MTRTFAILPVLALASSTACRTEEPPQPRAVEDRGDFVIVHLQHAECTEIAATINELLEAGREATRRRGCTIGPPPWPNLEPGSRPDEAQILADTTSNSIVLRGSVENMQRIVELISRLDADDSPDGRAGRE